MKWNIQYCVLQENKLHAFEHIHRQIFQIDAFDSLQTEYSILSSTIYLLGKSVQDQEGEIKSILLALEGF
jgi:hypothetical protein